MITFDIGNTRFNFRTVGIALDGDRILIHKALKDDFWALPGGRVEMLESAEDALKREMYEELEVEVQVERLVWIVENFFELDGKSYHELAFYFLMTFPPGCHLYKNDEPFLIDDGGVKFAFEWHLLGNLEHIRLYPTFLKSGLNSIPKTVEHIVHTD